MYSLFRPLPVCYKGLEAASRLLKHGNISSNICRIVRGLVAAADVTECSDGKFHKQQLPGSQA